MANSDELSPLLPILDCRVFARTSLPSPSRRRYSHLYHLQQNLPLYQRLLNTHVGSITNPNLTGSGDFYNSQNGSAATFRLAPTAESVNDQSELDLESQVLEYPHRASILGLMRPNKLIGLYKPMADWLDLVREHVDLIASKRTRQYYRRQNHLIHKFQEIDNLLDAGRIHVSMLSRYDQQPTATATATAAAAVAPLPAHSHSGDSTQKTSRFNDHPGNFQDEGALFLGYNRDADSRDVVVAILVNFAINFLLLVGKIVVSLMTNSMSVIASLVDSVLDFLSTFIIFVANKLSNTKSWHSEHAYPVGRSRLEPLGVLIFSIIIIILFVQVGQELFKRLVWSAPADRIPVEISVSAGVIMASTIVSKIGCWIWCLLSKSSSVRALAQDAMTDIVFNTISLLMPTMGYALHIWWLDSLGALLLSVYIVISWSRTAFEHIDNLTGAVADPLDYKVILYLAYRFAESIKQITALKVYHVGDNLNVEIDVVFAMEEFDLSFRDCHDIAEALQYAIETLPMVERAFVHIDYMEANFKGHLN